MLSQATEKIDIYLLSRSLAVAGAGPTILYFFVNDNSFVCLFVG